MTVRSEPYFWAVCDGCGDRAEYGDWSAMATADQAVECLEGWVTVDGKDGEMHYCFGCTVWSDEEDCYVPDFDRIQAVGGEGQ